MTAQPRSSGPVRFELAPVAGGRARWEWSIPLDLEPVRLTAAVFVSPSPHLLLVLP